MREVLSAGLEATALRQARMPAATGRLGGLILLAIVVDRARARFEKK